MALYKLNTQVNWALIKCESNLCFFLQRSKFTAPEKTNNDIPQYTTTGSIKTHMHRIIPNLSICTIKYESNIYTTHSIYAFYHFHLIPNKKPSSSEHHFRRTSSVGRSSLRRLLDLHAPLTPALAPRKKPEFRVRNIRETTGDRGENMDFSRV